MAFKLRLQMQHNVSCAFTSPRYASLHVCTCLHAVPLHMYSLGPFSSYLMHDQKQLSLSHPSLLNTDFLVALINLIILGTQHPTALNPLCLALLTLLLLQGVVAAATLKQDEEAEALQAAEEASGAATVYAAALQAQARLCHTQPAACIGYATANASLDHSGGPGLLTEGGSSSSAMVHHNAGAHARAPSLAGSSSGGDDGSSSGAGDRHGSSIAVVHGSSRVLVRAGSSGSSLEGVDSDFDFAETAAEDDHWATSLPASIHQDALQGTMQGTMQECMHAVKGAMQGLLEQEAKAIARAGVSFELAAAVAGVSMEEVHAAFRGV